MNIAWRVMRRDRPQMLSCMNLRITVVDDVMQAFNAPTTPLRTGAAQFDVSLTGSLAYAPGGIFSEDLRTLVWVDQTGTVMPLAHFQPRAYWRPRLARDGQRLPSIRRPGLALAMDCGSSER
jgi:hypothetical protein